MEGKEFKAGNTQDAIVKGLSEMELTEEEADIEIVSEGGFLKKAVVKISKKQENEEIDAEETEYVEAEEAQDQEFEAEEMPRQREKDKGIAFLEGLFERMNFRCTATVREKNDEILYVIKGGDTRAVIGYRGEVLDAIQKLVAQVVKLDEGDKRRIVVDSEFYREKRTQTLTALARRLARKAVETGDRVELEPMNSYERRIIHAALQDVKTVTAQSEGEGKDRHIVISPVEGAVNEDRAEAPSYTTTEKVMTYGRTNFTKKGPPKVKSYGKPSRRY